MTLTKLALNARRLHCNLSDLSQGSLFSRRFHSKVGSKEKCCLEYDSRQSIVLNSKNMSMDHKGPKAKYNLYCG